MSSPDFFALPRPPRAEARVELSVEGRAFTVALRAMDLLDAHRMATLRDRMVARYVRFEFRRVAPEPEATPPIEFPPVGGESLSLCEETCEQCAALTVMQSEPQFTFEAFVALAATCPSAFDRLVRQAAALNATFEADAGKAGGARTSGSFGSPSASA